MEGSRRNPWIAAGGVLLLALAGCAPTTELQGIQSQLADLQRQMLQLQRQMPTKETVEALEAQLARQE
ncbi:MAG: hypothetical protein SX243_25485, partial [Acidobacteriota bacterium]|nr:hypothetical protein [Acidobacteriota bacterium]